MRSDPAVHASDRGWASAATCSEEPAALAPEPDREQVVGEVSGAAEAHGIHPGMRLGEALARCPGLRLVPPDPERAASTWETVLAALEGIGAAVEPAAPGRGLLRRRRRCAGCTAATSRACSRACAGRSRMPARLGAAPSRFCAFAAAAARAPGARREDRPRRGGARVPRAAAGVAAAARPAARAELCPALERLGVRTLGELAALPARRGGGPLRRAAGCARASWPPAATRRCGRAARRGAGRATSSCPRRSPGIQLERTLELLIDRLLARPERRGRAFRRMRLGARFVEQGTWRREVTLRQATADRERLRLALSPRLARAAGADRAARR